MTTTTLPTDTTLMAVADALDVLSMSYATGAVSDWASLARLVKNGGVQNVLSVGDLIEEKWIDTADGNKEYSLPWGVRHFGQVELADGTTVNGMYLQTQYATVKTIQFSHQRAFLRCPEGLSAGTYYFTIESTWGNNVSAGDVVCFTLTQDVPAGGRLAGCYGAPDQPKENWKIYTYAADCKTVLETITPTFEAIGTDLGIQKYTTKNGNLNSCQEMAYGWNRWSTSAYRQYLNSNKGVGEWWTPMDEWDIAPDQLNQIPGFLSGLPQEMIEAMLPAKTRTYLNTVNDTGVAYDDTYDKVFLPSLNQMFIKPQISDEGEVWDYWKLIAGQDGQFPQQKNLPKLIQYATDNRTSAQWVRLRSAQITSGSVIWVINTVGYVGNINAFSSYRSVPACVIGKI